MMAASDVGDQCAKRVCSMKPRNPLRDLTSAIVPTGTPHPAQRWELGMSLGRSPDSHLRNPFEIGAIDPHPLKDHGQFPGNDRLGFADAAALGGPAAYPRESQGRRMG
jgi:hypothetical protein